MGNAEGNRRPKGARRRELWFERGADALASVRPDIEVRGCCCPLCLRVFTEPDDFSIEHVPPASIGGREMVLTCKECNHRSGAGLDVQMKRIDTLEGFARRQMKAPMRGQMTVGGVTTNVSIVWRGDRLEVAGIPAANNPARIAENAVILDSLVGRKGGRHDDLPVAAVRPG